MGDAVLYASTQPAGRAAAGSRSLRNTRSTRDMYSNCSKLAESVRKSQKMVRFLVVCVCCVELIRFSAGLPVLTVQTVDLDAAEPRKTTPPATITPSHTAPPQPSHPHQIHNVEVLLEAVQFSPSSNSLSVSPVLIWRAGRPRAPVADRRPQNSVAVKNLSDALNDTSRPATTDSVEKVTIILSISLSFSLSFQSRQSSRPQSRQIPER